MADADSGQKLSGIIHMGIYRKEHSRLTDRCDSTHWGIFGNAVARGVPFLNAHITTPRYDFRAAFFHFRNPEID